MSRPAVMTIYITSFVFQGQILANLKALDSDYFCTKKMGLTSAVSCTTTLSWEYHAVHGVFSCFGMSLVADVSRVFFFLVWSATHGQVQLVGRFVVAWSSIRSDRCSSRDDRSSPTSRGRRAVRSRRRLRCWWSRKLQLVSRMNLFFATLESITVKNNLCCFRAMEWLSSATQARLSSSSCTRYQCRYFCCVI